MLSVTRASTSKLAVPCARVSHQPKSLVLRTSAQSRAHATVGSSLRYQRRLVSTKGGDSSPEPGTRTKFERPPLHRRLADAWRNTPTKWYPLPIAVGALLLVGIQFKREYSSKRVHVDDEGREVVRLKGPWQVHVLGSLPLRNLSRLWGWLNGLTLPVWFRPHGFRLYAWIFGCNLDEIEPADLREYASLGEFFYRKLKDGARPVADSPLVSPADGRVLHFGVIKDMQVEQVKGITYSLDALLGLEAPPPPPGTPNSTAPSTPKTDNHNARSEMSIVTDEEFANVNGIEYLLKQMLGHTSSPGDSSHSQSTSASWDEARSDGAQQQPMRHGERLDASVSSPETSVADQAAHDAQVTKEMGVRPALGGRRGSLFSAGVAPGKKLFFCVVYLAPGDYHRFHSPTAWVVEKRRHFVGELFSVSPYVAKRVENLFVLNERVALIGRWRHGFFGMVPVGATNVGSIKIDFDTELRTNLRGRVPPPGTFTEAHYSAASPILHGQPLHKAQEMGGFCLGSTIVLVFEAPGDFEFAVREGQTVKVGESLGDLVSR